MENNIVSDGANPLFVPGVRVAGGFGAPAAAQTALQKLRRLSSTFLLWQDSAYQSNTSISKEIAETIALCNPQDVASLALEIRNNQGIRHAPLFMLRELVRRPEARQVVGEFLPEVIQRADEITMFLELYWKDGKVPIAAQVKKGLGKAFQKFGTYGFAKYKDEGKTYALRDVLHMVHAKPLVARREKWTKLERKNHTLPPEPSKSEILYAQLSNKDLPVPETREVLLSAAKTELEKKAAYIKLLGENKLGPQALLMNLAGMDKLGVPRELIKKALVDANPDKILPLQFFSAFQHAQQYGNEIDLLMQKCMGRYTRIKGKTVLVVDCSGSMMTKVSGKSEFSRFDAVLALTVMAREVCEELEIYLTAGNDGTRVHRTEKMTGEISRGFSLVAKIQKLKGHLGGGGIFTRQAIDHIKKEIGTATPDRIVVLSDSEDCDRSSQLPSPFGKYNYIINVASSSYGINYKGVWTSEISGWSQMFIEYIAQCEAGTQLGLF